MRLLLIFTAVWFCNITPSYAQDILSIKRELQSINRLKPLQNPRYIQFQEIFDRNLRNAQNKVVGSIEDMLIDESGKVIYIYADLDRLHLRKEIYLDYDALDIESMVNGYRLSAKDKDIKDLYPDLVKSTLAIGTRKDLKAVSSFYDLPVVSGANLNIGKISNILFDEGGRNVVALYVIINYKTMRNEGISIPFSAVKTQHKNFRDEAYVTPDWSSAMFEYVND